MKTINENTSAPSPELLPVGKVELYEHRPVAQTSTYSISMEAFCLVMVPYAAFLAADEDSKLVIDTKELKVLVWLMRGSEPSPTTVICFMKTLGQLHDGKLSVMEWVSYVLEIDKCIGTQSFATRLHLLFAATDLNGDTIVSLQKLQAELSVTFRGDLAHVKSTKPQVSAESAWGNVTDEPVEIRRKSRFASISKVVAKLAKETMEELVTTGQVI